MPAGMEVRAVHGGIAFDVEGMVRIYEEAFPRAEREPTGELLKEIESGRLVCLVAEERGSTVGFAVSLPLEGIQVLYLEYLAVAPDRRSHGIGGALFDHLALHHGLTGIVFEVEPPALATAEDRESRERRIAFYERHGASVVACAPRFRAPNLAGGEPLPFLLMWLPLAGVPRRLEGSLLTRCATQLLVQGYGLPDDDPLVGQVARDLEC